MLLQLQHRCGDVRLTDVGGWVLCVSDVGAAEAAENSDWGGPRSSDAAVHAQSGQWAVCGQHSRRAAVALRSVQRADRARLWHCGWQLCCDCDSSSHDSVARGGLRRRAHTRADRDLREQRRRGRRESARSSRSDVGPLGSGESLSVNQQRAAACRQAREHSTGGTRGTQGVLGVLGKAPSHNLLGSSTRSRTRHSSPHLTHHNCSLFILHSSCPSQSTPSSALSVDSLSLPLHSSSSPSSPFAMSTTPSAEVQAEIRAMLDTWAKATASRSPPRAHYHTQ